MKSNAKKLAYTGMFAAMIFVLTAFIRFPVPSGYVHFGDAVIYVASVLIGPWAMLAGALGEGIADLISFPQYVPATVIIKILVSLPFVIAGKRSERLLTLRTALMCIPALAVTVLGYFIADMLIDKTYALVDIPGNIVQAVASGVIFIIIAAALDKVNIKSKMKL